MTAESYQLGVTPEYFEISKDKVSQLMYKIWLRRNNVRNACGQSPYYAFTYKGAKRRGERLLKKHGSHFYALGEKGLIDLGKD